MEPLRKKLQEGKNIVGVMIQDITSPLIIPLLDECGYDFVVLDQEHGPSTHLDIQNFAVAAKNLNIQIIVRAAKISYEYMAKLLDMGADGLMIPHVDTAEQAQNIIQWSKYPPVGNRSYGMRQFLSKHYPCKDSADYIKTTNENTTIFIQVESPESSAVVEELVSIPYVDGVIMGPADFTMNLGIIGQYSNEKFVEHAEKVQAACKKHKKGFGIHLGNLDLTTAWKQKGMDILMYSNLKGLIKDRANQVISKLTDEEGSTDSTLY